MNKTLEKIRGVFKSPGVKIVLLLAVPVVLILLVVMIYVIAQPAEEVDMGLVIDNFETVLPSVPEETRTEIERRLYVQVQESGVSVVPENGALIRTGSVDRFTIRDEFYVGDFIVDIGSIQQSYIVKYFYGQLEDERETELSASVTLYCIEDPDEIVYQDFVCKANWGYEKPDPIQYILPKDYDDYSLTSTYSLSSESGYAVVVTLNPPESVYLDGKLEEFENETMQKVRDYLTEMGLNPDDYEFVMKYAIVE